MLGMSVARSLPVSVGQCGAVGRARCGGRGWALQILVLALPPASCATSGKSLLLWASTHNTFS